MLAAEVGYLEVVKLLLDGGADPNQPDYSGLVALDYAVEHEKLDTASFLRQKTNPANVCEQLVARFQKEPYNDTLRHLIIERGCN
jgi:ankyrin repeat protein